MKCKSCGTKIKNSESQCPGCGKKLNSSLPDTEVTLHYKDYNLHMILLNLASLIVPSAIAVGLPLSYHLDGKPMRARAIFSTVMCVALAIFIIVKTIASIRQNSECCLTFSEKGINGIVPFGFAQAEHLNIDAADITSFTTFSSLWRTDPEVYIHCGDEKCRIKCYSNKLLFDVKKELKNRFSDK